MLTVQCGILDVFLALHTLLLSVHAHKPFFSQMSSASVLRIVEFEKGKEKTETLTFFPASNILHSNNHHHKS